MPTHRQQLKLYWKPDGTNADPAHEAAIKQWMRANGLSLQPGTITTLLYSPVHRSARAAIVAALIAPASRQKRGGEK